MANGNGENDRNNPTTVNFASGIEAVSIHSGHWHNCITAQTNEIYCWGDGKAGKLGDGATTQHNFAGSAAQTNHFSGSKPVLNFGNTTSWAVHPTLPTGLALGSTNGTIWGTPTPPSHKQTSPSTLTTRAGPPPSCSAWVSIQVHLVRSNTSQKTARGRTIPRFILHRNSSTRR